MEFQYLLLPSLPLSLVESVQDQTSGLISSIPSGNPFTTQTGANVFHFVSVGANRLGISSLPSQLHWDNGAS